MSNKMDIREVLKTIPSIMGTRVLSFSCKVDGWLVRYGTFIFEDFSIMVIDGNGIHIEYKDRTVRKALKY